MQYFDFDLEIGAGLGGDYPVMARSSAGEARGTMRFPLDDSTLKEFLKNLRLVLRQTSKVPDQVFSSKEYLIRDFGQKMFEALFAGEILTRYDVCRLTAKQQSPESGVRVRLHIQAHELVTLPWEYLYDPRQAEYLVLSRHTPLLRYLDLLQPIQPLAVDPPLRILAMSTAAKNSSAKSQDTLLLQFAQEQMRLQTALDPLKTQGLVELVWVERPTWESLQAAMWGGPWHIFHFIGQGSWQDKTAEGGIVLTNKEGKRHLLTGTSLGRLLADHHTLRLVILSTRSLTRSGKWGIFSITAATLARRGIPAVLAMQDSMTYRASIECTRVFYEALAQGTAVERALTEARIALSLADTKTYEWGTPILYLRAPDGTLFNLTSQPSQVVEPLPSVDVTKSKQEWLEEGYRSRQAGHYEQALEAFQCVIQLEPSDKIAYLAKGDVLRILRRPEEAWAAYKIAFQLSPKDVLVFRRLGYVHNDLKEYDQALAFLTQAIELDSTSARAYAARGDTFRELNRLEEALADYDQAIHLDPQNVLAHTGKGDVLRQLRRYREALASYEQAGIIDPGNERARIGKSAALFSFMPPPMQPPSAPLPQPPPHQSSSLLGTSSEMPRPSQPLLTPANATGKLLIKQGEESMEYLLSTEATTIGRMPSDDLCLKDDLRVSRHHAVIHCSPTAFILTDLGSGNGTYLNDKRLDVPAILYSGDRIRVGHTELTFLLEPRTDMDDLRRVPQVGRNQEQRRDEMENEEETLC